MIGGKNATFPTYSYIETFKMKTFFLSLEQINCPVYEAKEIKKQEQKEAIKKLYP